MRTIPSISALATLLSGELGMRAAAKLVEGDT